MQPDLVYNPEKYKEDAARAVQLVMESEARADLNREKQAKNCAASAAPPARECDEENYSEPDDRSDAEEHGTYWSNNGRA